MRAHDPNTQNKSSDASQGGLMESSKGCTLNGTVMTNQNSQQCLLFCHYSDIRELLVPDDDINLLKASVIF